jgi:hypothetical protein
MKVGRKPDLLRAEAIAYWRERFPGLPRQDHKLLEKMTPELIEQLDRCKNEEAQRLILGVSMKEASL